MTWRKNIENIIPQTSGTKKGFECVCDMGATKTSQHMAIVYQNVARIMLPRCLYVNFDVPLHVTLLNWFIPLIHLHSFHVTKTVISILFSAPADHVVYELRNKTYAKLQKGSNKAIKLRRLTNIFNI